MAPRSISKERASGLFLGTFLVPAFFAAIRSYSEVHPKTAKESNNGFDDPCDHGIHLGSPFARWASTLHDRL